MTRCVLRSPPGILDPKLEIIAPVRIWEFKSREEEIEYAQAKKIPIDVTKKVLQFRQKFMGFLLSRAY